MRAEKPGTTQSRQSTGTDGRPTGRRSIHSSRASLVALVALVLALPVAVVAVLGTLGSPGTTETRSTGTTSVVSVFDAVVELAAARVSLTTEAPTTTTTQAPTTTTTEAPTTTTTEVPTTVAPATTAPPAAVEPATTAAPPPPSPAPEPQGPGLPPDSYWDRMAVCETAGNWAHYPNGTYTGGLGIYNQTWLAWGGGEFAPKAGQATREQQIIVANRIATLGHNGLGPVGYSAWGCVSAVGYP